MSVLVFSNPHTRCPRKVYSRFRGISGRRARRWIQTTHKSPFIGRTMSGCRLESFQLFQIAYQVLIWRSTDLSAPVVITRPPLFDHSYVSPNRLFGYLISSTDISSRHLSIRFFVYQMYLLIFFFLLPWTTSAAGGGSPQGKWNVTNPNSQLQCIILYAQIDLELSYIVKGTDAQKDVLITVPTSSVVNRAVSSCNQTVSVANHNSADSPVYSQVMQLDLDHMNGWYLKMYFTTDSRIPTDHGKQWAMYRVDVQANYTTQADKFPDAADSGHLYTNQVFLDDDNEFADYIYAPLDNSLYCPSKQKYIINTDNDIGPRATITFSLLNVQAYMTTINPGKAPFGTRQTCPTDQHTTDKVPLIVGGCLAGLIVLVMVLYLVYRACLPKEVIHLVNPHSHHENKAMSIDEDNEDAQHH